MRLAIITPQHIDREARSIIMLVNLTPHPLSLVNEAGETVTVPPSGRVARVQQTRADAKPIAGFGVTYSTFGQVVDLPEPEEGVVLVVSALVLAAVSNRRDVFAPGEAIRDGEGRVVGARGLSCTPAYYLE